MPQRLIKQKLAWFLKLTNPDNQEIASLADYLTSDGFCHGFSISYGSMLVIADKQAWWEAALIAIAVCPYKASALEEWITLPGADHNNAVQLKDIFTRVLNYIVYHQASDHPSVTPFQPKHLDQLNILTKFFEFLHEGKIYKIEQLKSIAGYFSIDSLEQSLNANTIAGNICLLQAPQHTICLAYKDNRWILYDPNYLHTSPYTIHRIFNTKRALAREIIQCLGSSIGITVAAFDHTKVIGFPEFEKLLKLNTAEFIQDYGLYAMAETAPELLPTVINSLVKNPSEDYRFAVAMMRSTPDGLNTLQMIALSSPSCLQQALQILARSDYGAACFAKALQQENSKNLLPLHTLALSDLDTVSLALEIASRTQEGIDAVTNSLCILTDTHCSAFFLLGYYASKTLPTILRIADQSNCGSISIAQALFLKSEKILGLEALAYIAPQCVMKAIQIAVKGQEGLAILISGMYSPQGKVSGIDIIKEYIPELQRDIEELIERRLRFFQSEGRAPKKRGFPLTFFKMIQSEDRDILPPSKACRRV
ncbi:MAG: hypothetical protein H0W64_09035 [Gammaproteobacteria bacterium]|nr:hypothetical protein [Gammaproteobacteria bacterium]